jgi:hypothetical protein
MTLVQVLLTAAVALLIVIALRSRRSHRTRAAKKLAFLLLALASIVAILFPSLVQSAASFVGVGRGSDLVLYVSVLLLLYTSLDFYLRFQDVDAQVTALTRAVALVRAEPDEPGPAPQGLGPPSRTSGPPSR